MEKKSYKRPNKYSKKNLGKLLRETIKSYWKLIKVEIEKLKYDRSNK